MIKSVSTVGTEREYGGNSDCLGFLESSRVVKWFKPSDLEIRLGELYPKEISKGRKRHLYEDIPSCTFII